MSRNSPDGRNLSQDVLSSQKAGLRRRLRALRESMVAEQVLADSLAVCRQLASWSLLQQARAILTYLAFRNELDMSCLFELLPEADWIVPRVSDGDLILHRYDPARLVRHRFGMLEPDRQLPQISPSVVDLVLTPGVAFDRRGYRLGYGGGFYDRFLPTTHAVRVGVTYDFCLLEELPVSEQDQRVHWVVTPREVYRVPSWSEAQDSR